MDKRDPLFITLNTQTLGQLPKNQYVFSKNDSYKGELCALIEFRYAIFT